MMVELAVGDAYGACFEYADPSFVAEHNTLERYVQHPTHPDIAPGAYTDDTQMTLALAELLITGEPWTPRVLADKFVEVFHRDPRAGYAGRFHAFLRETRDGAAFLERMRPDSDKSGAAMRAAPIGLLPDVAAVLEHAAVQARVTHDTPLGISAAQAAALAVHYCHHELGPFAETQNWVAGVLGAQWAKPWHGKVGSKGWMSVRAALTALTTGRSLSEILRTCVAYTGDVDTVATIALAAASRSAQVVQDLPDALVNDLEDGEFGRAYLVRLDDALLATVRP
ncbi:ADP-ribosylglycohydrolase family protein [Lentzea tibetensis]|uniref:ADP-ribosylglycohydrolase family protein n=1 Tax=Lentzea tibetensis TaxID=2591470 RepID=A0A563F015_9PSEU|nr:ADP-ribosylglycohydrolase family protein [Lentzea tibetensis]TWP53316.1 ADP-ribosylglycohydrolase family protein [Lentzea tibetensis]